MALAVVAVAYAALRVNLLLHRIGVLVRYFHRAIVHLLTRLFRVWALALLRLDLVTDKQITLGFRLSAIQCRRHWMYLFISLASLSIRKLLPVGQQLLAILLTLIAFITYLLLIIVSKLRLAYFLLNQYLASYLILDHLYFHI